LHENLTTLGHERLNILGAIAFQGQILLAVLADGRMHDVGCV
jgi:hypothetical protein